MMTTSGFVDPYEKSQRLEDELEAVADEVKKYPGHHPGLSLAENVREMVKDLAHAWAEAGRWAEVAGRAEDQFAEANAEVVRFREQFLPRLASYFGNGGLFNPEMMEHDKVRKLLYDIRDALGGALAPVQPCDGTDAGLGCDCGRAHWSKPDAGRKYNCGTCQDGHMVSSGHGWHPCPACGGPAGLQEE